MTKKFYIVGNWKMNQKLDELTQFFKDLGELPKEKSYEAWLAPQAIHISLLLEKSKASGIKVGSQNISDCDSGAHTGEISASGLLDLGASFSLVGHSERRAIYEEDNAFINRKVLLGLEKGLNIIFCCGETLEEKEAGNTETVLAKQIEEGLKNLPKNKIQNTIIAYEPVWAIGTGKTAGPEEAESAHVFIRNKVETLFDRESAKSIAILYGGSVKPANIQGLLSQENIDGALVGGASLKGADFAELCGAADKLSK